MKYVEGEPIDIIKEQIEVRERIERRNMVEDKCRLISALIFEYEARLNTLSLNQLVHMRANKETFDPPARIF